MLWSNDGTYLAIGRVAPLASTTVPNVECDKPYYIQIDCGDADSAGVIVFQCDAPEKHYINIKPPKGREGEA